MTAPSRWRARRTWIALASLGLIASLGVAASGISPPMLLSLLDGAMGAGRGVEKAGDGTPFGMQGQRLDVWRSAKSGPQPLPVQEDLKTSARYRVVFDALVASLSQR